MKDYSKHIIRNILQGENACQDERATDQGLNVYITGLTILMVLLVFVPFKSMGAEQQLTSIGPIEVGTTIRGEQDCLNFKIASNRPVRFKLTIGENPPVPGGSSGPIFKTGAWWGGWDSGSTSTTFWQHSFCATTPSTIYYYVLSIYDSIIDKYEYMTGAALTAQLDVKITLEAITLHDDSDDLSGCECEFHAYVNNVHLFQYGNQSDDNWISSGETDTISGFEHFLIDVGRNKETITLKMHGCDLDDPSGSIFDPETYAGTTHDCDEGYVEIPFSSYRQGRAAHQAIAGGDLSFTALFGTEPRYISRLTSSGEVFRGEHAKYPPPEIMEPITKSTHWDSKPVSTATIVTYPANLRLRFSKEVSPNTYEIYKMDFISKTALELQNGLLVGKKNISVEPGRYSLRVQASMSKESGGCSPGLDEKEGKCISNWSKPVVFTVGDKEEMLSHAAELVEKKSGIKERIIQQNAISIQSKEGIKEKIGKRVVKKYESEQQGMKGISPKKIVKKDSKTEKFDLEQNIQNRQVNLNKEGALSVRKIFRVLNPEENHEYNARKRGTPKKGYKELATVVIRIRSPQKTKISFSFKQRLLGLQQFKDLEIWESKEDDMRWMPDIQEYQYLKYNSLEPAQYQLIANPHKTEVRPDDLTPIRFTVIGNKERRMRERLKASATLEKKENEKIPLGKALTEWKRHSKFEVLSPPDKSLQHNRSVTVKIGSPAPVGFNFKVQEILPDGVGLKVPEKINQQKSSDIFEQVGGRWVSTIPINLEWGTRYQVTVTPTDDSISKGKMWSRFTILSKEVIDNQKKIKTSGAVQMKKSPMIEPSIVLGGKRSYGPNENVMFVVKGNPTGKPQVECFDGRRWSNKCSKDIRLQKMGAGAQTRYILRTSTGGRYRLRVGKLLSDEIKVEKPLGKKVADTGKEPVQVSPQAKRTPQEKKQTKPVQDKLGDTKKKMPVKFDKPDFKNLDYGQIFPGRNTILFNIKLNPAYKNLKVKYELYKDACKGKPFKVSTNNNFGKLPAGRYCVRAAYLGGKKINWSKGIPFVVEEKKRMIMIPKKKNIPRKPMVTK